MKLFFSRRKEFERATMPFAGPLFRLARWRLGNVQDAEDAVQETFLRAYRSYGTFQPGSNMRAWLSKILVNVINDSLGRTQREVPRVSMDENLDELELQVSNSASHRDPQIQLSEKEFDEDLSTALRALPVALLNPLLLREIDDLSYQEISTVLEVPPGTVMSRLYRARQLMRNYLTKLQPSIQKPDMSTKKVFEGSENDM